MEVREDEAREAGAAEAAARPLHFTFGNHMHWVDMQWLWGYQVLPGCIDDMLALCAATGARGNVNFDGVGYEKLAAEAPEALARLRDAVQRGIVEVVGASYGQPYGLFQGGESNVRQRVFGARVVRRLLGVWPRAFWEEEFDFFPQLPQILRGCGFEAASLFFQWTWHTPSVPVEDAPLVLWEGIDGSRLPTLSKTELCLHQWPEDFEGKLGLAAERDPAVVQQWLELMPSPDWMCRSELLLPRLRELFEDPRFELVHGTLSEVVQVLQDERDRAVEIPHRAYSMDDVFHGMTLGKNGDAVPRLSDRCEAKILAAEALASTLGLLGRPYAWWHVYPAWELDEAWRECLQAQHHDVHECEGLCGAVGKRSFERALGLAEDVLQRGLQHLARQVARPEEPALLVYNPLGWQRDILFPALPDDGPRSQDLLARDVPGMGWTVLTRAQAQSDAAQFLAQIPGCELAQSLRLRLHAGVAGDELEFSSFELSTSSVPESGKRPIRLPMRRLGEEYGIEQSLSVLPEHGALELLTRVRRLPRLDPGYAGALRLALELPASSGAIQLLHDTPFATSPVRAQGRFVRKYPSGDWMTSAQFFEEVEHPLTARTFVDLVLADGSGLLLVHDGSQGLLRTEQGVEFVLNARDPWDEQYWQQELESRIWIVPHGAEMTHCERHRRAQELRSPGHAIALAALEPDPESPTSSPARFAPVQLEGDGVLVTALHREHPSVFEHVEEQPYADTELMPFVLRLVEFDGVGAELRLRLPGEVHRAARCDLLGRELELFEAQRCSMPEDLPELDCWSELRLQLRAHEIVTLQLDLQLGRHQSRHLDAHRQVWATVHRR